MNVEIRFPPRPDDVIAFDTDELRREFLIPDLFRPGAVSLTYSHLDRIIVGGAVPTAATLKLEAIKETGTANFLDRRELAVINVGGDGRVVVDGETHALGNKDALYVGMGAAEVSFASDDSNKPAKFYLLSAPAHFRHPTRRVTMADAKKMQLGAKETANERTICQFIHPDVMPSCQLVVGMTLLAPGSVWNTMPCHIHDRRSEVYLYVDLPADARVFHFMGEPSETRHLVVADEEAVLSPGWSIHSGCGTANYVFIWAMAGDNVDYKDVDPVAMEELR